MNKKLQVFVSSTYTDLIEERQSAVEAILDAGHIPAGMELFKGGKSQMKTIQKWIDNSDIYMLILGGRYGSIEDKSKLSYTQLEYEYAISKNMPVFAIVLEDSFLFAKAIESGKKEIFESENIEKYNKFKEIVKTNVVRFASNKSDIKTIIHSHLKDIMDDPEYDLIGWIKSNECIDNLSKINQNDLYKIVNNTFQEITLRNTDTDMSTYTKSVSKEIINMLDVKALLESSERVIQLKPSSIPNMIKVTTTHICQFSYIKENEPYFSLYTHTTRQQSETYKVEKLLINGVDYTSQIELSYRLHPNKGQFIYNIYSEFVPPSLKSCNVYYKYSYECPALDFFQTHRLSYPCENFSVSVILENELNEKYSVLGATFSSFSKVYFDDFQASEVHNIGMCILKLPNWSLPGAGYAISLKNKSEENHI